MCGLTLFFCHWILKKDLLCNGKLSLNCKIPLKFAASEDEYMAGCIRFDKDLESNVYCVLLCVSLKSRVNLLERRLVDCSTVSTVAAGAALGLE